MAAFQRGSVRLESHASAVYTTHAGGAGAVPSLERRERMTDRQKENDPELAAIMQVIDALEPLDDLAPVPRAQLVEKGQIRGGLD